MVKTLHEEIRLSEKLFGGKHPFWRTILGNVVALNTSITHAVESSIAISKSIPEVCGLIWTQWQGIRVRKATRDRWEKERHTKQKRPLNNSVAVFFFFFKFTSTSTKSVTMQLNISFSMNPLHSKTPDILTLVWFYFWCKEHMTNSTVLIGQHICFSPSCAVLFLRNVSQLL